MLITLSKNKKDARWCDKNGRRAEHTACIVYLLALTTAGDFGRDLPGEKLRKRNKTKKKRYVQVDERIKSASQGRYTTQLENKREGGGGGGG
jgi:hypothetical protein